MLTNTPDRELITLGGGCFWCLEAVFAQLQGVLQLESGYCNGHLYAPTYEQVCSGLSGHVEVVQVQFDPRQLPLSQLLAVFFDIHDPSSLNRQGADVGTQYRSGIYWHDEAQREVISQALALAQSRADKPLVTEVLPCQRYFKAEPYHQRYYEQNSDQAYCAFVISPKLAEFRRRHRDCLRSSG